MKKYLVAIIILLLTLSCDGDNDITFQEKAETSLNITVNAKSNEVYVADEIPVELAIQAPEYVKSGTTYSLTFDASNLLCSLIYAGAEYSSGESIKNLSGASVDVVLKTMEAGESNVVFTLTSSAGAVASDTLFLKVKQTSFTFNVDFDYREDYINDLTPFNLKIKKEGSENLTYKAYFRNVNGEIRMLGADRKYKQNDLIDVYEGNNKAVFKGQEIKEAEIEFIVEGSNGDIQSQKVSFNILPTTFDVSISPNPINSFYQFPASFKISIFSPNVDNYFLEYKMRYETTLTHNVYLELRDIDNPTGSSGVYDFGTRTYSRGGLGLLGSIQPAQGEITFIITDSNGVEVRKTIEVNFYE